MTTFADELRQKLVAKTARPRAEDVPQEGGQEAAVAYQEAYERRLAEADAAGQSLVAEIFRPLVDDFRGVLESLGVLDDGLIAAEAGPAFLPAANNGSPAGRRRKRKSRPGRLLAADYRAFLADRAAHGLPPPSPADPAGEMAEFHRFMAAARQRAAAAGAADAVPQWRRLAYRAGGVENGRRYEVRVVVSPCNTAATTTGVIELWCECLSGSLSDFRRDSAPKLIELPRKRVAVQNTDRDAARQWCQNVLSQSAAAILEAEAGVDPAPAAPLRAVPAAADIDVPMMA